MATEDLSTILPRVVIVSRRSVRKNKFVDFVGEYHLDLIVNYGAVPIIVPRVSGIHMLLESFEPIHGVLLCEGEDIDPSLYESDLNSSDISPQQLHEIRQLHSSDTAIDKEKDSIEFRLAKLCLDRNIPYLGICRGSQVLNVACGGTLYQDIETELHKKLPEDQRLAHMNYENYDGHRHLVKVVQGTPLNKWFKESLVGDNNMEMFVNSYHHQGVKQLAKRFVPMAFAPDGLIEGFYDPNNYNPDEGKFIMGLQFHPERMRKHNSDEFDYSGCPRAYQEFVKAVVSYQRNINSTSVTKPIKLDHTLLEKKRRVLVRSFSLAREIYFAKDEIHPSKESELKVGEDFLKKSSSSKFLQSNIEESQQQETKWKEGWENSPKGNLARKIFGKMPVEQLTNLVSFYQTMGKICSQVLDTKIHGMS
ncbi:unnamed protein product [Amaranthus hypochondriacus]